MIDPRDNTMRRLLPFNASAYEQILRAVHAFVLSRGGSRVQTLAIMINIARETGGSFDPRQREVGQRKGRGGFGILQWTAARARKFVRWAHEADKDPRTLAVQIEYLIGELDHQPFTFENGRNPHGWTRDRVRFWNSSDVESATFYLVRGFIRPGYVQTSSESEARRKSISAASMMPEGWESHVERTGVIRNITVLETRQSRRETAGGDDGVRNLQKLLNALKGEELDEDGIWGPKTAAAVRRHFGRVSRERAIEGARQAAGLFVRLRNTVTT